MRGSVYRTQMIILSGQTQQMVKRMQEDAEQNTCEGFYGAG